MDGVAWFSTRAATFGTARPPPLTNRSCCSSHLSPPTPSPTRLLSPPPSPLSRSLECLPFRCLRLPSSPAVSPPCHRPPLGSGVHDCHVLAPARQIEALAAASPSGVREPRMNSTPASGGAEELSLEQSLLEQGNGRLDDYVIEKAIGRGHFSVVHRAVRKSDNRKVALKKVQIFDMMDAKARDRCLKEVKLLQTLEPHPCIIQYLDSFITDNELYIVFEFAEHGDLRRLLRRALECNATLQEPQIWRYFTQVNASDTYAHVVLRAVAFPY